MIYDSIIIGAGPAGMTSAIYMLRANKNILIFEASTYGGQIINSLSVENYPGFESISGFDLATSMYKQVKKLGGDIRYENVLEIKDDKSVVTNKGVYKAKSIIIATGTKSRKLMLPQEDDLIGKGVSYCATCDGNFYKDKIVAVVGGGNTAVEDAIYLSNIAKLVYLIHRRDTFRAEESYLNKLKELANVKVLTDCVIKSLNKANDILTSINVSTDNNEEEIKIDGLFIAIGQEPQNLEFANVVDLEDGYVVTVDGVHTKTPGIYVAGDARKKDLRQLTTAVGDGSVAASVAIKEMR